MKNLETTKDTYNKEIVDPQLAWDNISMLDKKLFEAFLTPDVLTQPANLRKVNKRVHILALPLAELLGPCSYAIYRMDEAHNVCGSWMMLNGKVLPCVCEENKRTGLCGHAPFVQLLSDKFLEFSQDQTISEDGFNYPAIAIEEHSTLLGSVLYTFLPFHLLENQVQIPSATLANLKDSPMHGWVTYLREKYINKKPPPKDHVDFLAIGTITPALNLVLQGNRRIIRDRADAKKLQMCVDAWQQLAAKKVPEVNQIPKQETTNTQKKSCLSMLTYKKPPQDVFYISDPVWRQCLFCVTQNENMMLLGPAGTGKTELAGEVAKSLGKTLQTFDLGAMTEARVSLIGSTNYSPEKGTFFGESRFVKAITTEGSLILLDEISRAPRDAANLLLPVLDKRRHLAIDETAQVVKVAKDVCFIATANVGVEYSGTSAMDRALRDRFSQIELSFPPAKQEIDILIHRTGIPAKFAGYLVAIANKQRLRASSDQEFSEQISTRMLLNAARQLSFGISFRECIEFAILGMFSSDGQAESDRSKIQQIVASEVLKAHLDSTI